MAAKPKTLPARRKIATKPKTPPNPLGNILHQPDSVLARTGLVLPPDLDEAAWIEFGRKLGRAHDSVMWLIGEWWAFGEHHYGDRTAIVTAEDWGGPAPQTCMNAASVWRKFGTSRHREVLSFSHHAEVAGLPDKRQANRLLDWCAATITETGKRRSTRALREEVQRRASIAAAKAEAKDLKARSRTFKPTLTYGENADRGPITLRTSITRAEPTIIDYAPVWRGTTPSQATQAAPPPSPVITAALATIEEMITFGLETTPEDDKLHAMLLDAQAAAAVLRAAIA